MINLLKNSHNWEQPVTNKVQDDQQRVWAQTHLLVTSSKET